MGESKLRLCCFGKLPFWREYLEVDVKQKTAVALKQWLHLGREHADLSAEEAVPDRRLDVRYRFLLGLPGSPELTIGVLRPSRDQESRRFPFVVFTHITRKAYGKHYALLPLSLNPIWEVLADSWDSLADASTREDFKDRIRAIEVPVPQPVAQARGVYQGMQQERVDGLFEPVAGASEEQLGANLPALLQRLKVAGSGPTVEFPVSGDLGQAAFETSFWIDLINRQFHFRRYDPSVFLDESAVGDRRVLLKYGALTLEDYPGIMNLQPDAERMRPMLAGNAPAAAPVSGVVTAVEPPEAPEGVVTAVEPPASTPPLTFETLLKRRFR